ncbi:MAG: hypothetical protein Q4A31_05360 [Corynebacterium sp.]|uniref:hypothetical protein n=1 Tax=Corynebacterium sp. TaxID=1720 RepID=UPI0026DBB768|nr:hypothetical protein [Corynebacterium sp.]MDO4761326.1 hypothetical protein [Corynebacterium sp.]
MIYLIDGRSGAGKTTYASTLGLEVIHLDDFYPGWSGLAEASRMVARDVLDPIHPGFWRWDWDNNCRKEWVALPHRTDFVIEGVGAITEENIHAAYHYSQHHADQLRDVTQHPGTAALSASELSAHCRLIVLELDADERKRRALRRDPDYAEYWHMWAAQEDIHMATVGKLATRYPIEFLST